MKYLLFLILAIVTLAHADIYRSVDEQGNVIFSDEPQADSELIELSPTTVYTPEEVESDNNVVQEQNQLEPLAVSYQLRIVSPANNESIWVSDGSVIVNVSIEPSLTVEHQLSVTVDGESRLAEQGSTSVSFIHLNRGSHTAIASVIDVRGQIISSSEPVQFHLHRPSVAN